MGSGFDNVERKEEFKQAVKDNSAMMVKTKASVCHKCVCVCVCVW